jgi:hypothetical protein
MLRPIFALAVLALAACASAPEPTEAPNEGLSAYEQCLRDHQMVAMAWEAIEEMCRKETEGS